MLKIIRSEILIIGILLLIIFLNINFYDYSLFINNFSQEVYLKQFFERITTLGDSLWYFIISITILLTTYFLEKTKVINSLDHPFVARIIYRQLRSYGLKGSNIKSINWKKIIGKTYN